MLCTHIATVLWGWTVLCKHDVKERVSETSLWNHMKNDDLEKEKGKGGGANHLMTECPRHTLHSKVWRSAPSCTRLCRVDQAATIRQRSGRHCTLVNREKKQATRLEHLSFAHLELQRMCARRKSATPCSWESSASTNPWTSRLLGTQGHHQLAERDKRALLSTPCRKTTSSDHAVNDDI